MHKAMLPLAAAGILMPLATAHAQVVGEWKFLAEPGTPVVLQIVRDVAHPEQMTATGDLNGSMIVFIGTFRNLKWVGQWYWYGSGGQRIEGLRTCAAPARPRPGTPGFGPSTKHYGGFDLTFNAAENRIEGSWKSNCSGPDGRAESGQPLAFAARRLNTFTAAAPSQPVGSAVAVDDAAPAAPAPGGKPTLVGEGTADERPCAEMGRVKVSASGSGSAPDTVFSTRYRLRPCLTDIAKKIQLDMPNPEGKRPVRIAFEGLRIRQQIAGPRGVIVADPVGVTISHTLPFIGVPRAGQSLLNIVLPGRVCAAPGWLAWLEFSDGSRSREPIGMIFAGCGIRQHPELLPDGFRLSGG